jgi:hypothetical protein
MVRQPHSLTAVAGSLVALAACAPDQSPALGSSLQELSEISASQSDTAVLGQAYHSERKKLSNLNCVTGQSELRGNSVSTLSYEKDMSFASVLNSLAGSLSVGLKVPVVSVNASADIAKKHASSELSETHHLVWDGAMKKEVYVPGTVQLSERGRYYSENRADLLEARCGNEFITEVDRGASFFATLKMDFFNEEDKLEVGGALKVNVLADLVEVEGKLRYIDEHVKRRTKVSVYVQQRGGRPERLLTIIPDNVMYCSLDNPAPCLDVFRDLIRYAKGDFAVQLADPTSYNVLRYKTQSYADSGLEQLVPAEGYAVITLAVRQKLDLIENLLRQALQDEARATDLLIAGSAYMTSPQRNAVSDVARKASDNVVVYADMSRYCYDNMNENCLTYSQKRQADIQTYDPTVLNVRLDQDILAQRKCEEARDFARDAQWISAGTYNMLLRRNWAPFFEVVDSARVAVSGFGSCADVAPTL